MTSVAQDAPAPGTRVLALLQVRDLETLRERSRKERTKRLSVKQSVDLLLPVIASLAAAHEDGNTNADLQPALGVTLYQCLIRQRLTGKSLDDVIAHVMSGEYKRPRDLERSIPRALEGIITRTFRYSPEDRFDSLRDLGAALLPFASRPVQQTYVADFGPSIGSRRRVPAEYATGEELEARGLRRRGDLKVAAVVLGLGVLFFFAVRHKDEGNEAARQAEPAVEKAAEPASAVAREEPVPDEPAKPVQQPVQEAPARPVPEEPVRAAAKGGAAAPAASASIGYVIDLTVQPNNAWIMLDHKPAGKGRLQRALPRDGKEHELHVGAPGYKVQALRFKDAAPPTSVVLEKRGAGIR